MSPTLITNHLDMFSKDDATQQPNQYRCPGGSFDVTSFIFGLANTLVYFMPRYSTSLPQRTSVVERPGHIQSRAVFSDVASPGLAGPLTTCLLQGPTAGPVLPVRCEGAFRWIGTETRN